MARSVRRRRRLGPRNKTSRPGSPKAATRRQAEPVALGETFANIPQPLLNPPAKQVEFQPGSNSSTDWNYAGAGPYESSQNGVSPLRLWRALYVRNSNKYLSKNRIC